MVSVEMEEEETEKELSPPEWAFFLSVGWPVTCHSNTDL